MAETIVTNSSKSLDYAAQGKAVRVNAMMHKVVTPGVVEGGTFTYASASSITVSNFVAYLKDNVQDISVREESLETYEVTVTAATSWIVLREEWTDTESSFVKIVSCDSGDIADTDVILGRTIWQGGTLSTSFDYTQRQTATLVRLNEQEDAFKIIPVNSSSVAYQNYVEVLPGKAIINGKEINFLGDFTGAITDTTAGRIDFICVDDTNNLLVVEGTDAASPVEPDLPTNAIILGKITRGASITWIDGSHIAQYRFDEYYREFAGKIDTLQVQSKILTNGDDGTGVVAGGAVLDGDTSTGTILQIKGTDGAERVVITGSGEVQSNDDVASDRAFFEGTNTNVAGGTQLKQTAGATVTTITTKGESAATDAGKTVISNNDEGVIVDIPASKDWEIQEAGVTAVKYIGSTNTLDVTGTVEADTVKINTTGDVFNGSVTEILNEYNAGSTSSIYIYTPSKDGFIFGYWRITASGNLTWRIKQGGYASSELDSFISGNINSNGPTYQPFTLPVVGGSAYYFSTNETSSLKRLTLRFMPFGS